MIMSETMKEEIKWIDFLFDLFSLISMLHSPTDKFKFGHSIDNNHFLNLTMCLRDFIETFLYMSGEQFWINMFIRGSLSNLLLEMSEVINNDNFGFHLNIFHSFIFIFWCDWFYSKFVKGFKKCNELYFKKILIY